MEYTLIFGKTAIELVDKVRDSLKDYKGSEPLGGAFFV